MPKLPVPRFLCNYEPCIGSRAEFECRCNQQQALRSRLRLWGNRRNYGLYFKKRLLRRTDAISYDHDAYGKVTEDYVASHCGSDIKTWKTYARNSKNETVLKHSVTLLNNIEAIVVSSQSERNQVLAVFVKHLVSVLPDGRRVEDIVLVR